MYYRTHCCDNDVKLSANDLPNSNKKYIEKLLNAIYKRGDVDTNTLLKNTFKTLTRGIELGVGKTFDTVKFNSSDHFVLRELSKNVGVFSAFKNHHQITEMVRLLKTEDGNIRKFKDFKEEALKLDIQYNKQWLKTEYDQAISASKSAKKWVDAERTKDLYPNLKYVAVKDGRTRQRHRNWDGIILPIDHKFWDSHLPPNDWGCRCTFRRTDKPVDDKGVSVGNLPKLSPQFNINYGKQSQIFDKSHPYFDVSKTEKIKVIKGFNNYIKLFPEYYKMNGVSISKWADELELVDNYEAGKILYKKLKAKVSIRPDVQMGGKNPEYIINRLIADRKTPKSYNNIRKHIDGLKKQCLAVSENNYYGVFELDQLPSFEPDKIISVLNSKITNARGKKLEGLYFIYKGNAILLTRKQILDKNFDSLYKMQ